MSRLWSPFLSQLDPYVPGEQPAVDGLVKLNTNESPYPPSPAVLAAIRENTDDYLRLYPDPESNLLKKTIAAYHYIEKGNVFVGNGSDEVLAHTFNAFFRQSAGLLFPDITYSFYPVYCHLYDIDYCTVPLGKHFQIHVDDYLVPNGGIIFPNPNAPSGIGLGRSDIIKLLEGNRDSVVVIDEAYIDFADEKDAGRNPVESSVELTKSFDNLLVIHTLSKSRSLAGIRLGYAIGNAELIRALNIVKNSFNSYPVDRLAEVAAIASFNDDAYFKAMCKKVIDNRKSLTASLSDMGFECLPSAANFIMARHEKRQAAELSQSLRKKKVIVRHFNQPRVKDYLRITVGSAEQNQRLLAALGDIIAI